MTETSKASACPVSHTDYTVARPLFETYELLNAERVSFGGLLRQLRAEARLTQEELAEAARLSPRSVSDLERGINRTAHKDTAELLAAALGLAGPARELFVATARGRGPAEAVLAAREGRTPGAGHRVTRWARGCPYRGLLPFSESDAEVFYGRERLAAELAAKLAARAAGGGMVVVTGASGSGKSSLLRAGLLPILARGQQVPGSERWPRIVMAPTKDPLTELAACLAAVGGPDALAVRDGRWWWSRCAGTSGTAARPFPSWSARCKTASSSSGR
jgi:transcriptional regulator with XRE-family HTH domain